MSAARIGALPSARRTRLLATLAATAALLGTVAAPLAAAPAAAATAAPVAVAVVVPITAQSDGDGLLDADELALQTSPAGLLSRELDEVLATSATIALDPMIPASIRILGTAAPDSAREWLDRLEAAPNEVFLLAYADADLTAFARTSSLDLSEPLGFGFAIDEGAFGPATTATPTPAPIPSPTGAPDDGAPPPLPTTEDLLGWDDAIARIAWPSEGSAVAADLDAYGTAAFDATLLSSGNVSETAGALADVSGMPVLVADSAASDLLREASTSIDDTTRGLAVDRLTAALEGLGAAHPGRTVVLTLDRGGASAFAGLADALDGVVAAQASRLVGLSAVLDGSAEPASVVEAAAPDHVARATAIMTAERAEDLFASILDDPLVLTGPRRLALLDLFAIRGIDEVGWSARADEFLATSTAILDAVSISDPGPVLVTSSDTSVPIRIENRLDFPVTVRVEARPQRPLIRIESPLDVTIEPGSSKTVRLDAQAITNGRVSVTVTLSSPSTGVEIGDPQRLSVDLQAQWETVGIVVGALLALVFAAGIVRNVVVRRRRAARERAAAETRETGTTAP